VQLYLHTRFGRHHVDTFASASERMVHIDAIDYVISHVISGCARVAVTGCAFCEAELTVGGDVGKVDL